MRMFEFDVNANIKPDFLCNDHILAAYSLIVLRLMSNFPFF